MAYLLILYISGQKQSFACAVHRRVTKIHSQCTVTPNAHSFPIQNQQKWQFLKRCINATTKIIILKDAEQFVDVDDFVSLPPAHHLVYFNRVIPSHKLLPNGTDPLQSPGPPFVRRMWAGGYLRFHPNRHPPVLRGECYVCLERIRDIQIKGREGEEKV